MSYKKLRLVKVDYKYCDFLRKFDDKVPYNKGIKELRPFIGILFEVDTYKYFAPLSSPKNKYINMKNTVDFLKIKGGTLGAINFNNMIPVTDDSYVLIDLNKKPSSIHEQKYQSLLKNQILWLNQNYIKICNKSYKLYNLYNEGKLNENIKDRCCNFKLLEEKSLEYIK